MHATSFAPAIGVKSVLWSADCPSSSVQSNDASLTIRPVESATGGVRREIEKDAVAPKRRFALALVAMASAPEVQNVCVEGEPTFVTEHSTDELLVDRWRTGDRGAGDELVRRCTPLLRSFFRRRTTENVDELMQRTLVACIRAIDRFEGRASFRSFLLGIAHKQLMMSVRSARRQHIPLQLEPCGEDNPGQLLSHKEDVRTVAMALNQTSPDFRRVLELFYWEDLSVDEIAKLLGLPAGTVKSRLARGRSMIKASIVEAARTGCSHSVASHHLGLGSPTPIALASDRLSHRRSIPTNEENENHDAAAIHPSSVSDRRAGSSFRTVHGVRGGRVGKSERRARLHEHVQECAGAGAVG
jgi:RNA polymerase sigma-70 factor (ECF subfamily)